MDCLLETLDFRCDFSCFFGAKAKKSVEENGERKIQEMSMQQSNALRELENRIRMQMKEVNMLQKSLSSTMADGKGIACFNVYDL